MNDSTRGTWLALITIAAWGVLPITLKIAARDLDPYTLTWYRFAVSAVLLGGFLAARKGLPRAASLQARMTLGMLAVATLGLVTNYVLYLVSLSYVSPTIANVVTQTGPLLLMVGGIVFFHERISTMQQIGIALLIVGLFVFFNRRLAELTEWSGRAGTGTIILLIAGVAWAVYALAQKALTTRLESAQILLLIYIGCAAVLLPVSDPSHVMRLTGFELVMLALSCLNTIVAYGALAEGLKLAGAARVGALLAVVPIVSLGVTWLTNRVTPGFFEPDLLNVATLVGAVIVTVGSALTAGDGAKGDVDLKGGRST